MKQQAGGVTAANGFFAASAMAGIKYENRKDMALVYSETPCVLGAAFTTNRVKAAPVQRDIEILHTAQPVHAVVLNTGTANACTGILGAQNNEKMATLLAEALHLAPMQVLTASTGVIGAQLPMEAVERGIAALASGLGSDAAAAHAAAEAIMTTDTYPKEMAVSFALAGKTVTVGGMSKGSGMIHPNMATMLSVITTDAVISRAMLQKAVSAAICDSFHMISVDRDTSTNDSVFCLANGLAGNDEIAEAGEAYDAFYAALLTVMKALAKQMAADGEGASKLLEVRVVGAAEKAQAVTLAKSVISSNLVKAAVYGCDANWGRIFCAMGYSGADFDPEQVDVYLACGEGELPELTVRQLQLAKDGVAATYDEEVAGKLLSAKTVRFTIALNCGTETATAWGCDLTHKYVDINADYRS